MYVGAPPIPSQRLSSGTRGTPLATMIGWWRGDICPKSGQSENYSTSDGHDGQKSSFHQYMNKEAVSVSPRGASLRLRKTEAGMERNLALGDIPELLHQSSPEPLVNN